MLLEQLEWIKKTMKDGNYALIRDEDGEFLCILKHEKKEGYRVLYQQEAPISSNGLDLVLQRAAGVSFMPVIDEEILKSNEVELEKQKEKMMKKSDDFSQDVSNI